MQKNFRTTIVGHSLGGAMSAILGIFMLEAGYTINQIVTFGQPKFTDEEGADRHSVMPLIRIVGAGDTVASVPPDISEIKYVHTGLKVSLNDSTISNVNVGESSNRVDDTASTDFSGILNHRMTVYLSRLTPHVDAPLQIAFKKEFYWVSRL